MTTTEHEPEVPQEVRDALWSQLLGNFKQFTHEYVRRHVAYSFARDAYELRVRWREEAGAVVEEIKQLADGDERLEHLHARARYLGYWVTRADHMIRSV